MGREVRRVPLDWQHPKDASDRYIPLFGGSFLKDLNAWREGEAKWREGYREDWDRKGQWIPKAPDEKCTWEEWHGRRPIESNYMPDWPESERIGWQMYEDTSEGTPISPVMATPEALARWLADNGASAFGGMTATYDQWLAMIRRGWAVGIVAHDGMLESGVAALSDKGPGGKP